MSAITINGVTFTVWSPVLGWLFFRIGMHLWDRNQPFENGIVTTGRIAAAVESGKSRRTRPMYTARVVFETDDGEQVSFVEKDWSSSKKPQVGKRVRVSYLADDPSGARNLDSPDKIFGWIFLGLSAWAWSWGGPVLVIVGAIVALRFVLFKEFKSARRSRGSRDSQGDTSTAVSPHGGWSDVEPKHHVLADDRTEGGIDPFDLY